LWFRIPVHFTREQAYEGRYVIQTEEPNLSPVEAVHVYKELAEVSPASKTLSKCGPCIIASLALLIHRAIEKKLKSAGLSGTEALSALKSLRVVDIALTDGSTKRYVTRPTPRVAVILRARHLCHRAPNPTAAQPNRSVETNRQTGMREINDLRAKRGNMS
jgi:hypothetical protein